MSEGLPSDSEPPTWEERRRNSRVDLFALVNIRRPGCATYRVRVHDLSITGCKAEFVDRPAADERVWIKFDGLEALSAIVRWVTVDLIGLEFDRPLHSAVFEMLVRNQD